MPELVINARKASISAGMDVRRILPFRQRRMVGPFIFMDHAGPIKLKSQMAAVMDVLPHPHIGLSTVTYLFGGRVTHRDSLGFERIIRPGEVNWMTAAKGITHSERFSDTGSFEESLEMLQTWVALPEKVEEREPEFNNYTAKELPTFTDKGVWMRLIAGEAYGIKSDVKTYSPLFYLHVKMDKGVEVNLPKNYSERGAYVAKGQVEVSGKSHGQGQLLVFSKEDEPVLKAKKQTTLMFLGGEPLGERFIWWNFVSSSKERIEQAKADWKAGRMHLPPADNKEFIELPENKLKPAGSETPSPEPLS